MPTASSAQMRRRRTRRAEQIAIRYVILFIFLITNSHIRPVPSIRAPATTKSNRVQFTSSVNCIVINGMSNRIADMSTMMINLLFCIIINTPINLTLLLMSGSCYALLALPLAWLWSCLLAASSISTTNTSLQLQFYHLHLACKDKYLTLLSSQKYILHSRKLNALL